MGKPGTEGTEGAGQKLGSTGLGGLREEDPSMRCFLLLGISQDCSKSSQACHTVRKSSSSLSTPDVERFCMHTGLIYSPKFIRSSKTFSSFPSPTLAGRTHQPAPFLEHEGEVRSATENVTKTPVDA